MRKALLPGILLAVALLGLAGSVSAAVNPTDTQVLVGNNYFDPKISCVGTDRCVLLAYNNATDNIEIYFTINHFTSFNSSTSITSVGYGTFYEGFSDYYSLPYDVKYDADTLTFRIIASVISPGTGLTTKRYLLYQVNGSMIADGADTPDAGYVFYDVDNYLTVDIRDNSVGGGNYNASACLGLTNFETAAFTTLKCFQNLDRAGVPSNLLSNIYIVNISAVAAYSGSASAFYWDFYYYIYYNATYSGYRNHTNMNFTNFPEAYSGLFFYDRRSNFFYYSNDTAVKKASSTTFSSWSSPVTVYYLGAGEKVKHMSWKDYFGSDLIAYQFVGIPSGIYVMNVSFSVPAYSPPAEYTNYVPVLYEDFWKNLFGYHLYDPKIACQPDKQHCAILVWDQSPAFIWGGGLTLLWSSDGFTGIPTFEKSVTFSSVQVDLWSYGAAEFVNQPSYNASYFSMPYDIMYSQADSKYYVLTTDGAYGMKLWSYTPDGGLVATGVSFANMANGYAVGFYGKDTANPRVVGIPVYGPGYGSGSCSIVGGEYKPLRLQFYFLNGTIDTYDSIISNACDSTCCTTWNMQIAKTVLVEGDKTKYDIIYQAYGYQTATSTWVTYYNHLSNIYAAFPTDKTASTYILSAGGDWKYARQYLSSSIPEGIYSTSTADFSSFSTPVLYYAFNQNILEKIKTTNTEQITGKRVYSYYRSSIGSPPQGIYYAEREIMPIYVLSRYTNPYTGATDYANTSASLVATDGYTESGSGSDFTIHSTLRNANNISFLTTSYLPVFVQTTFDVPPTCDYMFFYPRYLAQNFLATIFVADSITGDPVNGAEVRVNDLIYYTAANGTVLVPLSPLANVNFSAAVSVGGCSITYNPSGTPRDYFIRIRKTGYRDFISTNEQFVTYSGGGFSYVPTKSYAIDRGTAVTVHVRTSNLVDVDSGRVTVNASGFSFISPNQLATAFPFTWTVVNGTYPAYLTLYLALAGCTSTYNETRQVLVQSSDFTKSETFTLPYSSAQMPCQTGLDCTPSYCTGNTFYQLSGCNAGLCQCQYNLQTCVLCDPDVGCYDQSSSSTCHFDSECYGQNVCLDSYVLESWTCGAGGTCIAQNVECPYLCDQSAKVCIPAPAVAACDQSTTVGMLTCMRSGLMGFVGQTFDPLMTIMVALALVMLVILLLGLGFKAVSKTL